MAAFVPDSADQKLNQMFAISGTMSFDPSERGITPSSSSPSYRCAAASRAGGGQRRLLVG